MIEVTTQKEDIHRWKDFGKLIRSQGQDLLQRLDEFPKSILVTGCQRSGTSMTSELLNQSDELVDYSTPEHELSLEAALILYGYKDYEPKGRYCFQTTWLNDHYPEYFKYTNGHKMVWVLRNPLSVVRSMLYNWPIGALDELFRQCGAPLLTGKSRWMYQFLSQGVVGDLQSAYFGYSGKGAKYLQRDRFTSEKLMNANYNDDLVVGGVDKLHRACLSYVGKVQQIAEISQKIDPDRFLILEYDQMVQNKHEALPELFDFVDLTYKSNYADMIHSKSLNKKSTLSDIEQTAVKQICEPAYEEALKLIPAR